MARISDFKARMTNGGTRSNQFRVSINQPPGGNFTIDSSVAILCSAASLPAVSVDPIVVNYRGRPVNFAGERTFAPWTITIINDLKGSTSDLRNAFESWSGMVTAYDGSNGTVEPSLYQADMSVIQLDRNERALKSYTFYDAFPTEVGQIALSYENPSIETFDVTFVYNYYIPDLTTFTPSTSQAT
jgi:hypothetical protein